MGERRLRVLQVLGSLGMGGAESRIMDVYRHMDRSAVVFDYLTLSLENQYYEDEIQALGGNVIKLESPRKCGIWRHFKQLRDCLRQGGYDVVHAQTSYHCGLVMLAAWLEGVPVRIAHARTTGSVHNNLKIWMLSGIGRALIRHFSTVRLAVSRKAGDYLFGAGHYEVLPNAIDLPKYQNIEDSKIVALRSTLRISAEQRVIGHIGRFDPMKNHFFLLNWFAHYREQHTDAVLLFVGDGPLRSDMERLARELGIMEHVRFAGVRNDVPELIHIFDILVFPSTFEGLGGAVLEAQAAGIPAVVSDRLPTEVDLNLGLVHFCPLEAPFERWNTEVDACIGLTRDYETVNEAFFRRGFTLECEIQRLLEIYYNKD